MQIAGTLILLYFKELDAYGITAFKAMFCAVFIFLILSLEMIHVNVVKLCYKPCGFPVS